MESTDLQIIALNNDIDELKEKYRALQNEHKQLHTDYLALDRKNNELIRRFENIDEREKQAREAMDKSRKMYYESENVYEHLLRVLKENTRLIQYLKDNDINTSTGEKIASVSYKDFRKNYVYEALK